MKIFLALPSLFISLLILGCQQSPPKKSIPSYNKTDAEAKNTLIGQPVMPLAQVTQNFNAFWAYFNQYAQLFNDYPTFDENNKPIDKGTFLESINRGAHLPLVIYGPKNQLYFRLAKIPAGAAKDIGLILQNYANRELKHYRMEGKPIPAFDFMTLEGKHYTSRNTKGKIVLFKCWFINCVQCVAEMPALNKMVGKLQKRDDVIFLSLAIDPKKDLQSFLKKTKFDYETVSDQKKYMEQKLNVALYPTHFIINKQGVMVKAVSDEKDLARFLEKELSK